MPIRQSKGSLQYVPVKVSALAQMARPLTSDVVTMAFLPGTNVQRPDRHPQSGDYKAAIWLTDDQSDTTANCLVGPGGTVALDFGSYVIWVKVSDDPEAPEFAVDVLTIY